MILRILFYAAIVSLAVIAPVWLFASAAFLYAVRYTAYELIILAACIDAFYGLSNGIPPYYTLTAVCALVVIEWIKPRISLYNEGT